ncbi:helix-turn-helix domain-containing protein [uncultured Clostridium sp.]|uniref:helix-turn-helix domain-containing protein n=1 Tax=uncultured Clostridium sp. TaxID=59620 RepID=UPI00280B7417|nr:helix-turn-helix domain-containing protein [uncultured Clostridium sp.]
MIKLSYEVKVMLGDKIKELRIKKGLTQQKLADATGISRSAIAMVEKNKQGLGKENLITMSNFFGVTVDYLLSDDVKVDVNSIHNKLGDKIKKLRKERNLTQVQLAKAIGIAQSTIGMIESNKRPAGRETLIKLAEFFNVTVDYLLSEDNESSEASTEKPEINIPKAYTDKYKVTSRDKKQYVEEMKKANEAFFMDDEFNEEAKKEMLDLMSELFWEAKAMNKRKK